VDETAGAHGSRTDRLDPALGTGELWFTASERCRRVSQMVHTDGDAANVTNPSRWSTDNSNGVRRPDGS